METAKTTYLGALRTEAIHVLSGNKIITDAPPDNNGKGEAFSPTDLLSASLTSCMITIMGILANRINVDITGLTATTTKVMAANPRRVSEIHVTLTFPAGKIIAIKTNRCWKKPPKPARWPKACILIFCSNWNLFICKQLY